MNIYDWFANIIMSIVGLLFTLVIVWLALKYKSKSSMTRTDKTSPMPSESLNGNGVRLDNDSKKSDSNISSKQMSQGVNRARSDVIININQHEVRK